MKKRIECIVYGHVQLVMYRDYATRKARKLGLTGEVHNENDGTVTVIAEGDEQALKEYIRTLEKGSLLSKVEHIAVSWMEPNGEFTSFTIRY